MKEKTIKIATDYGILKIGDTELDVSVLDNGDRVVTHSAVFRALGREPIGNARIDQIPAFMDKKKPTKLDFIGFAMPDQASAIQ